jgi:hypothetical protein
METPLSALQQAYLLGRSEQWPLGGVAMHDFREYRGLGLDLARLESRLSELVQHYAALRTCIDTQRFTQHVRAEATLNLDRHDLRALDHQAAQRQLADLREQYSHQRHDPAQPLWRIAAIQLSETQDATGNPYDTVIFTSFDALILDGQVSPPSSPGCSTTPRCRLSCRQAHRLQPRRNSVRLMPPTGKPSYRTSPRRRRCRGAPRWPISNPLAIAAPT